MEDNMDYQIYYNKRNHFYEF